MSFVLNLFANPDCQSDKLGFQSSNTSEKTATAVVETLAKVQQMIDSGKVKDGSVIKLYAKVNITKSTPKNTGLTLEVDGQEVSLEEPAPAATEDSAPF